MNWYVLGDANSINYYQCFSSISTMIHLETSYFLSYGHLLLLLPIEIKSFVLLCQCKKNINYKINFCTVKLFVLFSNVSIMDNFLSFNYSVFIEFVNCIHCVKYKWVVHIKVFFNNNLYSLWKIIIQLH